MAGGCVEDPTPASLDVALLAMRLLGVGLGAVKARVGVGPGFGLAGAAVRVSVAVVAMEEASVAEGDPAALGGDDCAATTLDGEYPALLEEEGAVVLGELTDSVAVRAYRK
jgi:hypothetical protein